MNDLDLGLTFLVCDKGLYDIFLRETRTHYLKKRLKVYRGWNPTSYIGDYNKPLEGYLLNNQYNGK